MLSEQERLPTRILRNKEKIPGIGLGTFGSDHVSPNDVAASVAGALRCGYRLFDCASVYQNEHLVGLEFEKAIDEGIVRREDLFIISKVWNDMHGRGDVLLSCAQTLKDLRVSYLDAYMVHWPFPNYHAPGCDGDSRNPDSVPFSPERFLATWRQMEHLYLLGLVRHLGMSNMTIPKLEAVLPYCTVQPSLLEMEIHPSFQQPELFDYALKHGIQPVGFSPIGSPNRPERDRTEGDVVDLLLPAVQQIASNHGIHPVHVCLKWAVQNGQIPIPFSINNYESNLHSLLTDPLTEEEMQLMKEADAGSRLIKGQVFLWEGASGWEDLWDMDGHIVS